MINTYIPVKDLADKHSPIISKAFLESIQNVKRRLTTEEVHSTLTNGGIHTTLSLLDDLEDDLGRDIVGEIVAAASEGGKAIPVILGEEIVQQPFVFNILDARVANALNNSNARLLTILADNTRKGAQVGIEMSMAKDLPLIDVARIFIETLGLTSMQQKALQTYRTNLENDIELRKSKRSYTAKVIKERYESYRDRLLEGRSFTVGDNEALRAVSLGEYESLQQARTDGKLNYKLRRYWKTTMGEKSRAAHTSIPGMNEEGVDIDGVFRTPLGMMRYPRDPLGTLANTIGCRCVLIYGLVE